MASRLYTRDILRLAASISHHRPLADAEGQATRRSPVCGSEVSIGLRLDEGGRVAVIGQSVQACALGQASAALMGAHVVGRTPEELAEARDRLADWLAGRRDDPGEWPGLQVLAHARAFTARHGAILLPFQAAAEAAEAAAGRRLPKR